MGKRKVEPEPEVELTPEEELKKKTIEVAKELWKYADKEYRDVAVPVALLAMATLEVHRYMALVLAPMCPKAFRAQVKALSKTLDKVLNLTLFPFPSSGDAKKTRAYFTYIVLSRLNHFIEFMAHCHGDGTHIVVVKEGDGEVWDGLHTIDKGESEPELNFDVFRPPKVVFHGTYKEFSQKFLGDLGETFKYYNSKLFEFFEKHAGDLNLPRALIAFTVAHLYDAVRVALSGSCDFEDRRPIGPIDNILGFMHSREFNEGVLYKEGPVTWEDWLDFNNTDFGDAKLWTENFLADVAWCYGVDLNVSLRPKPYGMKVTKVSYVLSPGR